MQSTRNNPIQVMVKKDAPENLCISILEIQNKNKTFDIKYNTALKRGQVLTITRASYESHKSYFEPTEHGEQIVEVDFCEMQEAHKREIDALRHDYEQRINNLQSRLNTVSQQLLNEQAKNATSPTQPVGDIQQDDDVQPNSDDTAEKKNIPASPSRKKN